VPRLDYGLATIQIKAIQEQYRNITISIMKFNVILGCIFALAGIAAAVPGPRCINRADPDR
jgi:hypothetical protein